MCESIVLTYISFGFKPDSFDSPPRSTTLLCVQIALTVLFSLLMFARVGRCRCTKSVHWLDESAGAFGVWGSHTHLFCNFLQPSHIVDMDSSTCGRSSRAWTSAASGWTSRSISAGTRSASFLASTSSTRRASQGFGGRWSCRLDELQRRGPCVSGCPRDGVPRRGGL